MSEKPGRFQELCQEDFVLIHLQALWMGHGPMSSKLVQALKMHPSRANALIFQGYIFPGNFQID